MDTKKYNLVLVKETNTDYTFAQEFYDSDKHVKYYRVTWDSENNDVLSNSMRLVTTSLRSISNILPNVIKYEIGDSYYETLGFDDEDLRFKTNMLIRPIISKKLTEVLDDVNLEDAIISVYKDEEFISAVKEVYKDYLDKEV